MSPIPSDLISDILCRPPVKTLLRFKCVSKACDYLIDDPDFAKLHLDRSSKTNTNSKLFLDNRIERDDMAYLVDFDSLDNLVQFPRPFTAEISRNHSRIIGSCNGLLAVYHRQKGIALWNPSTRKCRYLPPLDDAITRDHADDYDTSSEDYIPQYYHYDFSIILGFGYDVISNDYKLVKMLRSKTQNCFIVMLYSLKANAWRRIKDVPADIYGDINDGAYINNSLHWNFNYNKSIFALDLATDEYYEVPLPEDPKRYHENCCCDGRGYMNVGVLGGCLCVFRLYCVAHVECHFNLWVMEEYGNKESWTELLSLSMHEWLTSIYHTKPVAYSKNGDRILMDEGNDDKLFNEDSLYRGDGKTRPQSAWFNVEDQKGEYLIIPGAPLRFSTTIYVESLVSVN